MKLKPKGLPRPNVKIPPRNTGYWAGKPMHAVRLATIEANK